MYCRRHSWIEDLTRGWRKGKAYKKCIHCGCVKRYNPNKPLNDHRPKLDDPLKNIN